MLRFDRYLIRGRRGRAWDLATGRQVHFARIRAASSSVALYETQRGRTLIDLEIDGARRVEVWEEWAPRRGPAAPRAIAADFIDLLDAATHGAPRAFDLPVLATAEDVAWLSRILARLARARGWVPIDVHVLGSMTGAEHGAALGRAIEDRSLVVFLSDRPVPQQSFLALLRLALRDARPHVLVRPAPTPRARFKARPVVPPHVHERLDVLISPPGTLRCDDAADEARARWAVLLEESCDGGAPCHRHLALARVLITRGQPFEARALLGTIVDRSAEVDEPRRALLAQIAALRRQRAASGLTAGTATDAEEGIEMVDDFVDVLRICQDVEDEQTALARVGALLRERLQAASVAFVTRDGPLPRVITRVGADAVTPALAVQSIETGLPISPARNRGPVECAWPVRHATEVIGAVWCRWGAGTAVATEHATTLLGIAATATAPSVRLAIARSQPASVAANPVPELVGESAAMIAVRDAILRAAASPFPVVIEGESGSGKELAARAIHARSARRERRFCAINCAALVDELVEAELFGHVRGAFTGAAADRTGVFEEANGGTLFLDEVVELGARVQAKLLRTLQEGEIRRLGENLVRKVDVRIVSATNRPLAKAVAAGSFRADLWYRLDVIRLVMPPLRERLDDLPQLATHLWRALTARTNSRAALSRSAIAALAAYDWPGNIRELQNVLASMLVSAPRDRVVGVSTLPAHVARAAAMERGATLADARRRFDERYIRAALAKSGGQTAAAARELGISRQGLSKLMDRLGILPPHAPSGGGIDPPHVQ